jgi:cytochrome P450
MSESVLTSVEPKEFGTLDVMTKISLRVMTRIIAGTELSRDEKFLDATHAYFGGNFFTGLVMLQLPFPNAIRDIIGWPLWKYHQVFTQGKVLKTIKPVIAKRMDDYEHGRVGKDELDAVACTLRLLEHRPLEKRGKYTPLHTLSHETLQLVWAAGQSPAMSITGALYKMLECPEYVEPMREEAQRAVSKHGWSDGIFNELPMIDSFIRETHRMNPAFSCKSIYSCD